MAQKPLWKAVCHIVLCIYVSINKYVADPVLYCIYFITKEHLRLLTDKGIYIEDLKEGDRVSFAIIAPFSTFSFDITSIFSAELCAFSKGRNSFYYFSVSKSVRQG